MKILQIFGAVVAVHLLAFIFIFASPGCQSGPRNIPTPDATLPGSGPTVAPVTYTPSVSPTPVDLGTSGSSVVTYSPASPSGQARPTRPGSPAAAAVVPAKPTADVTPVTTYTVGRGDSLWSIAKKNGLSVSELAKANNLSTGVALKPGQKLLITGKVPATTAAPKDLAVAAPATGKAAAEKPAAATATHAGADAMTYTVLPGESLGTIAKKFQMKTGELAAANSITDPSKVRAGQTLIIPGFKAVGSKTSAGAKAPVGSKPAAATPAATAEAPATAAPATPHFEIAAPPPGQDLDAGLKGASTEVPTIKVETPKTEEPPKK